MAEPEIVIAMKKFLQDYAWDKSLYGRAATPAVAACNSVAVPHRNTAVEEFVASDSAKRTAEQDSNN